MSQTKHTPETIKCEACGEILKPNKVKYLELSETDGNYYGDNFPNNHVSQGAFPFGTTCATKELNKTLSKIKSRDKIPVTTTNLVYAFSELHFTHDETTVGIGSIMVDRHGIGHLVSKIDKDECGRKRMWEGDKCLGVDYNSAIGHNMLTKPPFYAHEFKVSKDYVNLIPSPETAAERDILQNHFDAIQKELIKMNGWENEDNTPLNERIINPLIELRSLIIERDRLKEALKNSIKSAVDGAGVFGMEISNLQSINAELLEALKEVEKLSEYGVQSYSKIVAVVENAIVKAEKGGSDGNS